MGRWNGALLALIQVCVLLTKDLCGTRITSTDRLPVHEKRVASPPKENLDLLPLADDCLESPFDLMNSLNDNEDGVASTRITIRLTPVGSPEGMPEKNPLLSNLRDDFMNDVVKTMMSVINAEHDGDFNRRFFDDLPVIRSSRVHPKLVVVRRIHLSPVDEAENPLKNVLDKLFDHEMDNETADSGETPSHSSDKLNPKSTTTIRPTLKTAKDPQSWNQYKSIISKLSDATDVVVDDTAALKRAIANELSKQTELSTSGETKMKNIKTREFYVNAMETLSQIARSLDKASLVIKTEKGAMDRVTTQDRNKLIRTIDYFMAATSKPLDGIFTTSTKLTKINGKENDIPNEIYKGIVNLGKHLIHFGKFIYDDVTALRDLVAKENRTDSVEPKNEQNRNTEIKKEESQPTIPGRFIIFNPIFARKSPFPVWNGKPIMS